MAERKKDKEMENEEEIKIDEEGSRHHRWEYAKEKAMHLGHKADELVKENPWKSVAISAAVGAGVALAAAAIIGRRREESFFERLKNLF